MVVRSLLAFFALVGALVPAAGVPATQPAATYAVDGARAFALLMQRFATADGRWRLCAGAPCGATNQDWGADALTAALLLRRRFSADARIDAALRALVRTGPSYGPCRLPRCTQWSDVPAWDAVTALQEYDAVRAPLALAHARAALAAVDGVTAYAGGACPHIAYQQPGGGNRLKTLETDANILRAELLLDRAEHSRRHLSAGRARYAAIRRLFLDPAVPLYTVYAFDDGRACRAVPRRFFASVNGLMILDGLLLGAATGDARYRAEALATGAAAARDLNDAAGVFANLQAENDVAEPLVEAMLDLAVYERQGFARRWLLRGLRAGAGTAPRRFFDGPPARTLTAWEAAGAIALAFAGAALAPRGRHDPVPWSGAETVASEVHALPASLTFYGRGIALLGTLGERCCERGHARVVVDGRETFDRTGIWQNKSSAERPLPGAVLFAWRWPHPGRHTLRFLPGIANAKEGDGFLHVRACLIDP